MSDHPPALVTGGTGFIGSHLVERLLAEGRRVRCLVRRRSSLEYLPADRVEFVYGELARGEGLAEAVAGVETIFHLAGVTRTNAVEGYYMGNAAATRNLLEAARSAGPQLRRIVHVSSLAAVGPGADGAPVDERSAPRPVSHYGRSKLQAEAAVLASPLAALSVIVRPPVVYGPRDTDVYLLLRAAARGVYLRVGRHDSYVSYIYVADLVESLLAAERVSQTGARTYFVGNSRPASWREFSAAAAAVAGHKLHTVSLPPGAAMTLAWMAEMSCRIRGKQCILSRDKVREGLQRYWVADVTRACEELGCEARTSLEAGVRRTLEWYRGAGWLTW